jgi:hypothetical protein
MLFVCGLIGLLSGIALPKFVMARQSAGAASAIASMRAISSAQLSFALTCGGGFYAPNLTTLGTMPPGSSSAFLGPELGSANTVTRSGYTIQVSSTPFPAAPASCNGLAVGQASQGFKAGADAIEPNVVRFFATNANGAIYEDTSSLYGAMPEIGEPATGHVIR